MFAGFGNPWALALLALLPAALWLVRRPAQRSWGFSDLRLLPALETPRARWARRGGRGLRFLGLALLAVALAEPRTLDRSAEPRESISMALVVDISSSMAEEDFVDGSRKLRRLDGAKNAARLFLLGGQTFEGLTPGRPGDLAALISFATRPETACPLTDDLPALVKILESLEPQTAAAESTTNPGDALAWALTVLQRAPTRRKVVLLLSDGESNVPEGLTPRQAAQLAANLRIPIYTLDASPATSMDPEELAELEKARATLKAIAAMTGGSAFRANDAQALRQAYERIAQLERDQLRSRVEPRLLDLGYLFALAAFLCWAAVLILEATLWRQVP